MKKLLASAVIFIFFYIFDLFGAFATAACGPEYASSMKTNSESNPGCAAYCHATPQPTVKIRQLMGEELEQVGHWRKGAR